MNEFELLFQTAYTLRNAGFPQPKATFGQLWAFRHPDTKHIQFVNVGSALYHISAMHDLVFIPTAADIIKETHNAFLYFDGDHFVCRLKELDDIGQDILYEWKHEDAIIACCNCWFFYNQNNP